MSLERDELRGKVFLVWGCAGLAAVLVGAIVWGIIDWRSKDDSRDKIYENLQKASENLLEISENAKGITANLKESSAAFKPMLEAGTTELVSLKEFTDTTKDELSRIMTAVRGRMVLLDPVLAAFQGSLAELQRQIKQNGDTANGTMQAGRQSLFDPGVPLLRSPGLVPTLNLTAGHVNGIARNLETATARLPGAIDDADKTIVTANGAIAQFKDDTHTLIGVRIVDANGYVRGTGLVGVVEGANGALNDGRVFLHKTLFGPPCYKRDDGTTRGFFSAAGNCAKGVALTGLELGTKGSTLVRSFTATPVDLVNPVKLKQ